MPVSSPTYESPEKSIGAHVESLTTSAFDLPDTLSHKADPALIAVDDESSAGPRPDDGVLVGLDGAEHVAHPG